MLKPRLVTPDDVPTIQGWLMAHRGSFPPDWYFSDTGVIVPGVGAGFLYLTNSSVASLDTFVTNPNAKLSHRFVAINKITQELIRMATFEHNVRLLCCTSKIKSIKKLAMDYGFEATGDHSAFAKILNICPQVRE